MPIGCLERLCRGLAKLILFRSREAEEMLSRSKGEGERSIEGPPSLVHAPPPGVLPASDWSAHHSPHDTSPTNRTTVVVHDKKKGEVIPRIGLVLFSLLNPFLKGDNFGS